MAELNLDPWLSSQLNRRCFRCDPLGHSEVDFPVLINGISGEKAFVYARVSCDEASQAIALQDAGFRVVDISLTFAKKISPASAGTIEVREVFPGEEAEVVEIARSSYRFSRFHLDPRFERHEANALKGEWVRNYFCGKRGDRLLVAMDDGRLAGFVLLLKQENNSVIDLIAVAERFQRKGIGAALVNGAERLFSGLSEISAGTQAANIPSVSLYERLGFRLRSSQYLLHLHT